jgi:hypothetical protein
MARFASLACHAPATAGRVARDAGETRVLGQTASSARGSRFLTVRIRRASDHGSICPLVLSPAIGLLTCWHPFNLSAGTQEHEIFFLPGATS